MSRPASQQGRRSIDALVSELTLSEKASLTAGADNWSTVAIERLGIPSVRVTDGPNGARGRTMGSTGPTAACLPCGTALAATWDPALVERAGVMLGQEALTKSARVLLAPTVNIHRSPLAGRNFECYSEDPVLAGRLAAGYVRGVQSQGVACTVKHFLGNEAEFERHSTSSVIDDRALREIYLVPFELAVREGGALGIMTAYNRLNGRFCTEHRWLLEDILRQEWGFDGFVLTDWYALADTVDSPQAGLDLEMPGPGRVYGRALADAVCSGKLDEAYVDAQVRRLLSVFDRIGAFAESHDDSEASVDRPEHRAVAREAAAAAMVLLRNDGLLPLVPTELQRVALIGPDASSLTIMGGGSAALRPHRVPSLPDALATVFGPHVDIIHEPGCAPSAQLRAPVDGVFRDLEGAAGVTVDFFDDPELGGEPVHRTRADSAQLFFMGAPCDAVSGEKWSFRVSCTFTPEQSGTHMVHLGQTSPTRVFVDGIVILDAWTDPPALVSGPAGIPIANAETPIELTAGVPIRLAMEHTNRASSLDIDVASVSIAGPPRTDLLERAVRAAESADVAVVVVGPQAGEESEGFDRPSMDLPPGEDELVRAVVAANPRTVVVVNAGSPVTMEWAEDVPALLYAWLGGQEMAGALAEVLVGASEPGGRLPFTVPMDVRHNPSYGNFPGENGEVRYGEGILVGYRWYEARQLPVRFPFGHGLSYTTFSIGAPRLSGDVFTLDGALRVEVPVSNTGSRAGSEVVQCYVAALAPRLMRPPKELRAFAKVTLEAGQQEVLTFDLDDRAFAYWDDGYPEQAQLLERLGGNGGPLRSTGWRSEPGWQVDPGSYELHIGRSSTDISHVVRVEIPE